MSLLPLMTLFYLMQDDSYLDSYISTIGVDFVRAQNIYIQK